MAAFVHKWRWFVIFFFSFSSSLVYSFFYGLFGLWLHIVPFRWGICTGCWCEHGKSAHKIKLLEIKRKSSNSSEGFNSVVIMFSSLTGVRCFARFAIYVLSAIESGIPSTMRAHTTPKKRILILMFIFVLLLLSSRHSSEFGAERRIGIRHRNGWIEIAKR